jgi:surface polysaccharide O-acyltransferase-like enzyme
MGIIMASCCGFCQPLFAIVSGQLANTLLLTEADDPEFYRTGFQAIMTFIGVGVFLCIAAFLQVG